MNSAYTSNQPPWLLLVFTLPTKRASQRVEVWRKLRRYGVITLGNSGYLLPNDTDNQERFEWLASAVRDYGGNASVVEVQAIDNLSRRQLIKKFGEARAREYREIIKDLTKLSSASQRKRAPALVKRLRGRFQEIASIDFFHSPLQAHVEKLLKRAEADSNRAVSVPTHDKLRVRDYQQKLWVTRYRPGIDRSGSAWLIRRFIDPKARFDFAEEGQVPPQGIAYDMYHGGFGHRGEDCTFETLVKDFRIRNRKVDIIAEIIHDADVHDEKFGRPEGYGINEVLKGWARRSISDRELLDRGMDLFEGLYESLA
jgi:hypothetical protein